MVATAGPATQKPETVAALIDAGVDVFRLNFSHGTTEQHAQTVLLVRQAAANAGESVAILGDLCGPKIRIGRIDPSHSRLERGDRVEIVRTPPDGHAHRFGTNSPDVVFQARVGHRVLIDDGQIRLRVVERQPDRLTCTCEVAGTLSDRKGINLPDTDLEMPVLTDKDLADLDWAVTADLDYVAMSFVRRASDVDSLRAEIASRGVLAPETDRTGDRPLDRAEDRPAHPHIVSKIETPQAVADIDAIVAASDAVLVARGDLGVQLDLAAVPLIQKDIARRCRLANKPVIIATQMLQSMVGSPVPTRAEVSDVANAILDDADAVMLSAETSVGQYPVEAVRVIERVAAHTEGFALRAAGFSRGPGGDRVLPTQVAGDLQGRDSPLEAQSLRAAITGGAASIATELRPGAVCVWSLSGQTACWLSKQRLGAPVIGLAPDERIARRMCLYYGVTPLIIQRPLSDAEMISTLQRLLTERGWVQAGELFMVVAGSSTATGHSSHAIFLHRASAPPTSSG